MRTEDADAEMIGEKVNDIIHDIRTLTIVARRVRKNGGGGKVKSVVTNPALMIELVSACWGLGAALVPAFRQDPKNEIADADVEIIPKGEKG